MSRYGGLQQIYQLAVAGFFLLLALAALPATAADRLILALGDSLTAGYQLPPADSYPAQLEAALRARKRDVRVHNAGVSGDTSAQGLARLDWVLKGLPQKPALAIVALGANDMLRGLPVATTRRNLDTIVARLRQQNIPVVVAGMRAAPNMGTDYAKAYEAIFPAIARAHGASLYPFFLEGVAAQPNLLLADGMHPNKAGVAVMVRSSLPVIVKALDGAKSP